MAITGVVFRQSEGGPSGTPALGAGETFWIEGNNYPTARAGQTFGAVNAFTTEGRDKTSPLSGKFGGIAWSNATGNQWRWDLPEGAGEYDVWLALGAIDSTNTANIGVSDGVSRLTTITAAETAAGSFVDATGVTRTAADWLSSNAPVRRTFASSSLYLAWDTGGSTNKVAYVAVQKVAAGTAPTFSGPIPTLTGLQGAAFAVQSPTIASYFTGATSYSISPALPAGLSFNTTTAAITGTPSGSGNATYTVTGTNGTAPDAVSNTFAINIAAAASGISKIIQQLMM